MRDRGRRIPLCRKAEAKDSSTAVRHGDVVRVVHGSKSLVGDSQAREDDIIMSNGTRGMGTRRGVAEEEVDRAYLRLLEGFRNGITLRRRELARVRLAGV